jgi:hypothetical protein
MLQVSLFYHERNGKKYNKQNCFRRQLALQVYLPFQLPVTIIKGPKVYLDSWIISELREFQEDSTFLDGIHDNSDSSHFFSDKQQ